MTHIHKTYLRFGILIAIACAAVFVVFNNASAATLRSGQSYELATESSVDGDLYFVGQSFIVRGTTTGDVVSLGSGAVLEGLVVGDVFLTGGTVTLAGPVQGDARLVGGRAYIQDRVSEDALVVAGSVVVEKDAVIEGDLIVFGESLVVEGVVEGNLEAHVRTGELTGSVGKDATLYLKESLSITGGATVGGSLQYEAPREAYISEDTTIVGATRFNVVEVSGGGLGMNASQIMLNMLALAIAAMALITLLPVFTDRATERVLEGGGITVLKGLLIGFAWPLFSLLLMLTGIGVIPGALLLFSFLVAVFLAFALTPVVAGVVLARWLKKDLQPRWAWASLGAISLALIVFLPVIGWFVRFLLFFLTFGTLARMAHEAVWLKRKNDTIETAKEVEEHATEKKEADTEAKQDN